MDFLKISFPALPSPRLSQQISTSACTLRLRVPPTASSLQQIQPEEERENCANPPTWTTTNSLEISHAKAKSSTSPVQLAVLTVAEEEEEEVSSSTSSSSSSPPHQSPLISIIFPRNSRPIQSIPRDFLERARFFRCCCCSSSSRICIYHHLPLLSEEEEEDEQCDYFTADQTSCDGRTGQRNGKHEFTSKRSTGRRFFKNGTRRDTDRHLIIIPSIHV